MRRSEIIYTAILVPIDFCALLLAFYFSYLLRQKVGLDLDLFGQLAEIFQYDKIAILPPMASYLNYSLLLSLLMLLGFGFLGLYKIRPALLGFRELPKIIYAVSAGISVFILISFFSKIILLPRLVILFFWLLAVIFVGFGRLLVRLIQRNLFRFGIGVCQVAVLGDSGLASDLVSQIKKMKMAGLAFYQQYKKNDLEKILIDLSKKRIDQILIADHRCGDEILHEIREAAIDSHTRFTYIPSIFDLAAARTEMADFLGLPLIEIKPTPLDGWGRVEKRIFDLVLAFFAIIIFSPLMFLVACLIRLSGPGPIFFKQRRVGLGGKIINIYKFRTLRWQWHDPTVVNGKSGLERFQEYLASHSQAAREWQESQKLKDDPRVSAFGRFLRQTNIDELPQFFNILFGDLSLVGPRPIIESEIEKFGQNAGRIFSVRPGLTGLWQVSGRNEISYEDRVKLNVFYVENWNFWLDLAIVIKTIIGMFSRRGAY